MKQIRKLQRNCLLGAAFSSLLLVNPASARNHKIAVGDYHSLANESDSTVWAWGNNDSGQLGDNTFVTQPAPVQSGTIDKVISVAAGVYHSMALKHDGTVWTWGYNDLGPLGDGTNTDSGTPVQVSGLTGAVSIAAGYQYSLAVKSDGTVWTWGDNLGGQLGNGTTTNSNVPVQVSGLTNVIEVAGGNYHSLALKSDGTVWAWGYNSYGHLGDGTTTDQLSPVQVIGLSNVVAVAAGNYYSLALKNDGTVWAWGVNYWGTLGDGTNTDSTSPVQVSGLTNVVSIDCGHNFAVAVKSDGTGWAWGDNYIGQLGDGTTTSTNSPVQISGLAGATEISAGNWHSVALKSDGTAEAWGYNGYGALGDNSYVDSLTPVAVFGLTDIGPSIIDTDGDGLMDDVDPSPLVNDFLTAWTADAVNPTTKSLYASYNFKRVLVGGTLSGSVVNDITGNARHATARNLLKTTSNVLAGVNNGIADEGFNNAAFYHSSINAKSPILNYNDVKSLSFWFYIQPGLFNGPQIIFCYIPTAANRSVTTNTHNVSAIRALMSPAAGGGNAELFFKNWDPDAICIRERWSLDRTPAQLEGKWTNITFVWRGVGGGAAWAAYLDGRIQTRTIGSLRQFLFNPSAQDTFLIGAEATTGTGVTPGLTRSFTGVMDRVRLFTSELNGTDVLNIVRQDTDGDGIWDSNESIAGGTRPYTWNVPGTDTDGDGRTDIYEQANGTNPNVFD